MAIFNKVVCKAEFLKKRANGAIAFKFS